MTLLIPGEQAARRTRAALAYSGKKLPELSNDTGITKGTLRNIMSSTRPASATLDRLYVIADHCGVPRWFMEQGFAGATSQAGDGTAWPASPELPPLSGEDDERGRRGA